MKKSNIKDVELDDPILEEEIPMATDWAMENLIMSGYNANFTLDSIKELDRFFEEQNKEDGIIAINPGSILFALACYMGETIIGLYGGKWVTNEDDPDKEMNVEIHLDNKVKIWPAQKILKKYYKTKEENLYTYVKELQKLKETKDE